MNRAAAPRALSGLRVLDLSGAPGQYCGKLFADLGADVILIEPPGGSPVRREAPFIADREDPEAGIPFAYLNTNKRSLCLDLERGKDRRVFKSLAARADLVIETQRPGVMAKLGLGWEALADRRPSLVYTSITPFGQTGPCAHWEADDLVLLALGGLLSLGGYAGGEPVAVYGQQAYAAGSLFAAVASMAAVLGAEAGGRGDFIDVSIQEAVVMALENAAQFYDLEKVVRGRTGGRQSVAGSGQFPCKDGFVYTLGRGISSPQFWVSTVRWLNEEGVEGAAELQEPRWLERDFIASEVAKARFAELFVRFSMLHTKEELYRAAKARRIPLAPVCAPSDVLASPQLRYREFFVPVWNDFAKRAITMPGAPYRLQETPWRIDRPAPGVDQHRSEILEELAAPSRPEP